MRSKKQLDKGLLFLGIIVAVVLAAGTILYFQLRIDRITGMVEKGEPITALYTVYQDDSLLFSEVFLYDSITHKGSLFFIPGNTGMLIASQGKINGIDTVYEPGKPEAYRDQVERLIDREIDFYWEMSLEEVCLSVDLLKGLNVFVANPIERLEDPLVLLPSGSVVLDGDKVTAYLIEPSEEDDNVYRKHTFFQSMLVAIQDQDSFLQNDAVFQRLYSYCHTDLNQRAYRAFLGELSLLQTERLVFQQVLGVNRFVDDRLLLFPHYDGRLVKETLRQIVESLADEELMGEESLTVRIEIFNGTRQNGLASRTSEVFNSFGFEVVQVGNAETNDYQQTLIIDNRGNPQAAARAAEVIRCNRIEPALDATGTEADITLILGEDFDGRYCQ